MQFSSLLFAKVMKQKNEKKANGVACNIVTKQQVEISSTFVHFLMNLCINTIVNQRLNLAVRLTEFSLFNRHDFLYFTAMQQRQLTKTQIQFKKKLRRNHLQLPEWPAV